ncbi:MAG: hypothetical protein R3254_00970 [Thiomicrorhabdus sp.]|nr:hypothetical protein [Thiomicrorhabdus sp.]
MALEKIDKRNERFADITQSADGQVLIRRVYSNEGKYCGCVACSEHMITMLKEMTPHQLQRSGWADRKQDIDDYDDSEAVQPNEEEYRAALVGYLNELLNDPIIAAMPSMQGKRNLVDSAADIRALYRIRNEFDDIAFEDDEVAKKVASKLFSSLPILV